MIEARWAGTRVKLAPFLRLGSGIGGDRDGNPFVTAEIMRHALVRQISVTMDWYLEQVHELGRELRHAAAIFGPIASRIFARLQAEWQRTVDALFAITGNKELLESSPALARSFRNCSPYQDPLNHLQVELLRRWRGGETDDQVKRAILLTINGVAAGLRNRG